MPELTQQAQIARNHHVDSAPLAPLPGPGAPRRLAEGRLGRTGGGKADAARTTPPTWTAPGPVQGPNAARRIGQILIRDGVIDDTTEQKAAELQAQNPHRKFGEILVRDLGVDHHEVFSRLAEIYAFKAFDLKTDELDESDVDFIRRTLRDLPEEFRKQTMDRKVVPIKLLDEQQDLLLVVTPDPTDREVLGIAAHFGYRRTEICYGQLDAVSELLNRIGPISNTYLEVAREASVPLDIDEADTEEVDEAALDAEINQSLLTNLVEGCLVEAVRRGASDIHIVPAERNLTEFHLRIDGKLQLWYSQDTTKPESVIAVVKDRARGVDRFERDKAQDGFMQREIDGHLIRFRISILPIAGSQPHRKFEDIVIRILDDRKVITDLEALGLQPSALKAFLRTIASPQGMVILTGPTGSGKSTTLNAALHHVMTPSLCVLTVEDPVEYVIKGARQIKIGQKFRFEDAVRTILRHDPDIVMVGEMRDRETAEAAIKLANTGHLTFSTLHTNDALSAISRLYKMGIESFLIANAVNAVVAQRLVRTLCSACKKPQAKRQDWRKVCLHVGMTEAQFEKARFYRPVGCPACSGTGYKGRMGIHEVLTFSREIRGLVSDFGDGVDEEEIREKAVSEGMVTLRQSGLARVADGETTLKAVLAATSTGA